MAEARDRLSRAENVAAAYARWRRAINETGGDGGNPNPIRVRIDEPEEARTTTPFRWGATEMTGPRLGIQANGTPVASGSGGFGRGRSGTPRLWRQRNYLRSPGSVTGRENVSPVVGSVFRGRDRGRGRGRASGGSSLPSWYPRTPLRDITAITRAIERRRIASLREGESHQLQSPSTLDQTVNDPNLSASGAQLEHDISPFATVGNRNSHVVSAGSVLKTPYPTLGNKCFNAVSVGKVPKILLDITNQNAGESEFITPQKKLLNSIDTVEKVVMDELRKLKRTPMAKKVEREKKVRTLMSMR